ncbi:MAG: energy coupling factor transporter S component ThiW [Ruminococcus sp.]|nr:energy coupling factor transporter S component ThiW [Ruminococcus sp.]
MKKTNIHKLTFAAILVALAVTGSFVSFPIGASKCAPVQHLVNIIGAVFLGPAWSVGIAFAASLLRNLLGLGSLLAFPGSMVGAFIAGMLYKYIKKLPAAYIGELFGTSVLGGLLAYPVARFLVGSPAAAVTIYIMPFFVSCAGGTVLAIVIVTALKKAKVFDGFLGIQGSAEKAKA